MVNELSGNGLTGGLRSVVVEWRYALEGTVGRERDLLDAHFGVLEQFVAALLQRFAAFVESDRLVQRHRALFELIDDPFELRERRLERHRCDVRPGFGHVGSFSRKGFNRAQPRPDRGPSTYRSAASGRTYARTARRSRPSGRYDSAPGRSRGGNPRRRAPARERRVRW